MTPISLFKEQQPTDEASDRRSEVACGSPMASGLPKSWETVAVGHMVLAFAGAGEGWWESVVVKRDEEILTLRYRDWPKEKLFQRHVTTVALINPGPT